jgi:hypothetical protein
MTRRSVSVFAIGAMSAILLAACSSAATHDVDSAGDQIARAKPNQELLVLWRRARGLAHNVIDVDRQRSSLTDCAETQ